MTRQRQYLRATDEWQEFIVPNDEYSYILTTSGYAIDIYLSTVQIRRPKSIGDKAHHFSIGGSIGQMKINPNEYAYARVRLEDDDESGSDDTPIVTVVVDKEPIGIEAVQDVQEQLDNISVELMRLINRDAKYSFDDIGHRVDYEILARQFVDTTATTHIFMAELHRHIGDIIASLFSAEDLLVTLGDNVTGLSHTVERISTISGIEDLSDLMYQVDGLEGQIADIISQLDAVRTVANNASNKVDTAIENDINPAKETVNNVARSFAMLNNSIVRLCANNSPEAIATAFDRLLPNLPSDIVNVVTSIKNKLVEISEFYNKAITEDSILFVGGKNNIDTYRKLIDAHNNGDL